MLDRIRIFFDRMQQRLADLGSAIVSPVERAVGRATDKVLSASEHVDQVESLFARLLRIVSWPFRLVGKILQVLLPAVVYDFFASLGQNIQSLFGRLGIGILHFAEMLNLDRVVLALVWISQPVWRPIGAVLKFCYCWLVTRHYRSALMALPAIVLAALVLGVGTWYSAFGKSKIQANYNRAVRDIQGSKDYELRELYDQKLAQLGEDTQLTSFRTALALAEDGQLEQAYAQMQELAPEDRTGYPRAHFWIIQQLIRGQLVDSSEESKRLIRAHMDHLKSLEVEAPQLTLIQAMLLKQENRLPEAADLLEPLASQIPAAGVERMFINRALGRREQAEQDARIVITHMKSRSRGNSKLNATEYQQWLAAEEMLGNVQQMRTLLEQWHEQDPENQEATKLLSRVCRLQARNLLRSPLPNQQQVMELWLRAAKLDNSPDSLLKLARALYTERDSNPIYPQLLEAMHQSPNTPVPLLVAIGTEIAQNEEYQESRPFFAAAVSRDQENAVAWNNYGLVLSSGADPDLDEALGAVNKALQLQPKEYRFRETRGQILIKLERWQESIEDLEHALNGLPDLSEIHKSLAVAYSALGREELAELHRNQVD